MAVHHEAAQLARAWIEGWNAGQPDDIPLAPDFVHSSPFGTIQGRQNYLNTVKPMATQNVNTLHVLKTISEGTACAIWFEMQTPHGVVQVCDWVQIENHMIKSISSFYDPSKLPHFETYD